MYYKSLYRENPQDKKIPGKYYPYPVYENTIDTNDFVADSTMKQELQSEISFSKVPEKHNDTKKK